MEHVLKQQTALMQGGLSSVQAAIYESLVKHGPLPASRAAHLARTSRPLGYKALGELQAIGLVLKKKEPGAVALFTPAHPMKLREVADKKLDEARAARSALDGIIARLVSDFNTANGQPGIRILEGVAGIAELQEDVLNEGQTLYLIRSINDRNFPGLEELIQKQIQEQARLKLHTHAITPMTEGAPYEIIARDKERLVTRRIVPQNDLLTEAQVMIYADKVALTSYDGAIITTVIENPAIAKTFLALFEYVWKLSADDHDRIMRTIVEGKNN